MTPNPRNIFRTSPQRRTVMYRDGDTTDIIRVVMHGDADSAQYVIAEGVQALEGATKMETLANIFAMMQGRITYRADRPGHEIVRSPAYLFHTGVGDCKSYSIAIGAMLRALGIPYRYRFTSQSRRDFHHVYVVARVDGKDVPMDAVPDNTGKYLALGKERPYSRAADLRPGARIAAGLRGVGASVTWWQDSATLLVVLIAGGYLLNRFSK